ncbi:MAG: response regulator transcription factor [Ignavibacteriales bacterium]|nr:response regulator transcription factor [Ignavibacteriales bacterium]
MTEKLKIILADDHPLLIQGLAQVLSKRDNLQIVGQAVDGENALDLIRNLKPDIAILDVQMPKPDGFEIARIVTGEKLSTKIIFLTMFKEEAFIKKVIELGVKGYILKESAVTDIVKCIDAVAEDKFFLSPQVSDVLLNQSVKTKKQSESKLTPAETNILSLIGKGKSSKEIADELFISIKTVENHRTNICKKLGITGNSALLKYALKNIPS